MNLETYEMPPHARGWRLPIIGGRLQADRTHGGIVVHTSPGHPGDEIWRLPFTWLDAAPQKTMIRTYAPTAVVADTIAPDEALGYQIDLGAGDFGAISAATMTLKRSAPGAGLLSVEVWEKDVADEPATKIGLLGILDVATDLSTVWQEITVWSDRHAWPFFPPYGGYLVLNGNLLTAGTISWAGEGATANAHAKWSAAAWALANGELSATVWQGGDFLVLRGFQEAYCYMDGAGPQQWTMELDDGSRFKVYVVDIDGDQLLPPLGFSSPAGVLNAIAAIQPVSETGQQGLGV